MKTQTLLVLSGVGFLQVPVLQIQRFAWPLISPAHQSYNFSEARKASAELVIEGVDRDALYRLSCYGADAAPKPDEYFGEFDCHLSSVGSHGRYETLLVDDPLWGSEQYTRAVVLASQLVGACATYPEHGRLRHFRLRGMMLTLEYRDIALAVMDQSTYPALRSFRLDVTVEPDATALSAIAEPVAVAYPPSRRPHTSNVYVPQCDQIVEKPVPGFMTNDYIRKAGLSPPYKQIVAAKAMKSFERDTPDRLDIPILNDRRHVVYRLQCQAAIGNAGIGEWGIRCEMRLSGRDAVDLLDDAVDPVSRVSQALILPEQLEPDCRMYPEWGAVRSFYLRGLVVHVRITSSGVRDIKGDRPQSFDLEVDVEPDPTSTSPVALPPPYIYWGVLPERTCSNVIAVK